MLRFSGDRQNFRLLLDDMPLLEHTAQQPFAVMIRTKKTYKARRGTVKTTETEVERVKLTKALQLSEDTVCFAGSGHQLSVHVSPCEGGASLSLEGESGWSYLFSLPAEENEAETAEGEETEQSPEVE